MVGKHVELLTLDKVAEVLDSEVHGQEFSIECAIPRTELSREVGNRLPAPTNLLLQDGSNCRIRSIGHDACQSMWFRVRKQCDTG